MLTYPQHGQRVREKSSGHEGCIDFIILDESRNSGGHEWPNTVYVTFDDRHYGSFNDENDGKWPELELVTL